MAQPQTELVVILSELNGSGQTGTATLTAKGEQTEVALTATPGISELNHIHVGSCADLGGVAYRLTNMADGMSATTVDATLDSLRSGGFAINLHGAGKPGVYTACGDIPGAEPEMMSRVTVGVSKDNTLYESAPGALSNGAGEYLFVGNNNDGLARRAVITFDVAGAIPEGSTIDRVTLTLHMSRSQARAENLELHRLLAGWGEGASNASANEGGGAAATAGDATWTHRSFDDARWGSPGGDFLPEPSASAAVSGIGQYTWGPADRLSSDVQAWLDDPTSNFGWLLLGNEVGVQTTKRFDSRENPEAANRPSLTIEFALDPLSGGVG